MKIIETERTMLRKLTVDDAEFMLDLLNQPSFIKYIGDRNVRNLEQAADYIETRFIASYKKYGFGLYLVELKSKIQNLNSKIGINGFVKRDSLPDADIGFAFLPQFCGQGYAFESSVGVMDYGRNILGLKRVLAITSQDNESSGKLLEKIGLKFERLIKQPHDDNELKLFSWNA
jgi:RimJ/RimL family protein N-acetyltransferase